MKRSIMIIWIVAALSLVFVGSAFANYGPHGGYETDTDACAGCHRAHSSFSSVTYQPRLGAELLAPDELPSALLVSGASTVTEFCNACHGDNAPGASTNVVSGKFDSGPSAQSTVTVPGLNDGVITLYQTASTFGAPLNGGGFGTSASIVDWETSPTAAYAAVTSAHSMEKTGVLWGAGNASTTSLSITCTSCHDPHGSSNYRLLKDSVNGVTVGGYAGNTPDGFVFSTETSYPANNGWLKHTPGMTQISGYRPNYTSGSAQIKAGTSGKSLSAWCSGCHEQYDEQTGSYSYGSAEATLGAVPRHRHPVDIALKTGDANLQVIPQDVTSTAGLDRNIPLEDAGNGDPRGGHIGCLTCHFAHGSSVTMTGWASAELTVTAAGVLVPSMTTTPGVAPDASGEPGLPGGAPIKGSSALLRADNRGVCERCHNK